MTSEACLGLHFQACIQHFSTHYAAMVLTPEWGAVMRERVDLAEDMLRQVRESKATTADGGGGEAKEAK